MMLFFGKPKRYLRKAMTSARNRALGEIGNVWVERNESTSFESVKREYEFNRILTIGVDQVFLRSHTLPNRRTKHPPLFRR